MEAEAEAEVAAETELEHFVDGEEEEAAVGMEVNAVHDGAATVADEETLARADEYVAEERWGWGGDRGGVAGRRGGERGRRTLRSRFSRLRCR